MANFAAWTLSALAALAVLGIFALATFVFLHRMGRATSRFDRREED